MKVHDGFYERNNSSGYHMYTRDGRGWYIEDACDYDGLFENDLWEMTSQDYADLGKLMLPEEYLR